MIRCGLRSGLVTSLVNIFAILLGLTGLFGTLVRGWFRFSSDVPGAWLVLWLVAMWGGSMALQQVGALSWRRSAILGALAGVAHGVMLGAFVWLISLLSGNGVDLRQWLTQLTPQAIRLLTLGNQPLAAALVTALVAVAASISGALLKHATQQPAWQQARASSRQAVRERLATLPLLQKIGGDKRALQIAMLIGLGFVLLLPLLIGQYWNYTLGTVGIYVMLGLGLNIVVGLAGLLDLGYVAFFSIGAYTVAMLTAPQPHGIMMNFWLTLPIAIVLASCAGILLGIPVLRMRGDYLAIVTLGFGEIIRILSKSDLLTGFTGGPRGIRAVGGPELFGINLNNEKFFMYFILLGIILVAVATHRLQNSRVGRAWMAMREDEDVAEAMGINILYYKLLAFAIGAGFAGLGGAIFASRNRFTGPEDFTLLVSINVLCLVIIGGMGSIPGVVMGALVLKGLPEILRQLDDYRMLAFGALLVVMMIVRPEGLWPSARRRIELHEAPPELPGSVIAVDPSEV